MVDKKLDTPPPTRKNRHLGAFVGGYIPDEARKAFGAACSAAGVGLSDGIRLALRIAAESDDFKARLKSAKAESTGKPTPGSVSRILAVNGRQYRLVPVDG